MAQTICNLVLFPTDYILKWSQKITYNSNYACLARKYKVAPEHVLGNHLSVVQVPEGDVQYTNIFSLYCLYYTLAYFHIDLWKYIGKTAIYGSFERVTVFHVGLPNLLQGI
jgi:hypothetical protein